MMDSLSYDGVFADTTFRHRSRWMNIWCCCRRWRLAILRSLTPGHLLAVTSLLASHPPTDQPKNYTSSSKYMYDAFVYVYINNWSK